MLRFFINEVSLCVLNIFIDRKEQEEEKDVDKSVDPDDAVRDISCPLNFNVSSGN